MLEKQGTVDERSVALASNPALNAVDEAFKLISLCNEASITVDADVALRLVRYLDAVLEKNKTLNLTAIRDWDKALVLHLVDSLTMINEFEVQSALIQKRSFLDMGCGAGFPGIPIALRFPNRRGVLCDSVKKKIRVVAEFIQYLQLQDQLSTTDERLEVLGLQQRSSFGCVVARAVAPLPVLIEYAAPLLDNQGQLIVLKGVPSADEFMRGNKAAKQCGFELTSRRSFELPLEYGSRTIVTYTKVSESHVALPRAIGMASKDPLG